MSDFIKQKNLYSFFGSNKPGLVLLKTNAFPGTIKIYFEWNLEMKCVTVFCFQDAFRLSPNIKLDDRVFMMQQFKTLPCDYLLQLVYPDLYPIHNMDEEVGHFV